MTLSSSDIAAVRATGAALAESFESDDPTAWVDFYTDDAIFVGSGGATIEGRRALLELAPAIGMSSVEIVADSIIGAGDLAAALGRGSWISTARGPDAPRVSVRFLMVWRREADGRWRIARELLTEHA